MPLLSIISETLQRIILRGSLGLDDFIRLRENAMPIGIALEERRGIIHADAVWRETGGHVSYFGLPTSALEAPRYEIDSGEVSAADVLAALRSPPVQAWLSLHQFHRCCQCWHLKVHSVCEHCWEAVQPRLGAVRLGSLRSQLGSEICIDEICVETPDPVNVMRQKLAKLRGVPVGDVQFQGSRQEGNMIIGDFMVGQSASRRTGTRRIGNHRQPPPTTANHRQLPSHARRPRLHAQARRDHALSRGALGRRAEGPRAARHGHGGGILRGAGL